MPGPADRRGVCSPNGGGVPGPRGVCSRGVAGSEGVVSQHALRQTNNLITIIII